MWEIYDKFYNAHWFLTGYSCRNFPVLLREAGYKGEDGSSLPAGRFAGVMEHDVNFMIFQNEQFEGTAKYYANKLIHNSWWRKTQYILFEYYARKYFKASKRFRSLEFALMSEQQMIVELERMTRLQEQVRTRGVLLNGLIIDGRGHLTNALREELRPFVDDEKKFNAHWLVLTQVTRPSLRQQKDEEIARLAQYATAHPNDQGGIDKKLKEIHERWCWLDYMYYGPPATIEQFKKELAEEMQHPQSISLHQRLHKQKVKQQALMKSLGFTRKAKAVVRLAQDVLWQKGWRKDVEYFAFYSYESFFRELAKRKYVEDWRDLLYLLPWEVPQYIVETMPDNQTLKDRRIFSYLSVAQDGTVSIETGEKARSKYTELNLAAANESVVEVKGQCAYPGKVQGIVRLIFTPADMAKMNEGDILVSQATSPDLISAMKKAAAIVTSTGGLICHAAITSRELHIPCVVGTRIATEIFKDGDRVEVDAEKGIVRKIS